MHSATIHFRDGLHQTLTSVSPATRMADAEFYIIQVEPIPGFYYQVVVDREDVESLVFEGVAIDLYNQLVEREGEKPFKGFAVRQPQEASATDLGCCGACG